MSQLSTRLRRLEARRPAADTCPGHSVGLPPGSDWRAAFRSTLRAFSPDAADRDAYRREQDALAATPPCPRCGWRPEAVFVRVSEDWGQGDDDAIA